MVNTILKLKKEFDEKLSSISLPKHRPHDETIAFDMHMISKYCEFYVDCEGCNFHDIDEGCYFYSKTPADWK